MAMSQKSESNEFDFVVLNPKKRKRDLIEQTLSGLGPLLWLRFVPLGFRGFPETKTRSEEALLSATKIPKSSVLKMLKRVLLGWQYNGARRYFERHQTAVAVVWTGLNGTRRVFADGARDSGCKTLFYELGPLPNTLTVDAKGVNYSNSVPRDPEFFRAWHEQVGHTETWRSVAETINQRNGVKREVPQDHRIPDMSEPYIFVPLQVPGDSQLRLFGGAYRTVPDLINMICEMASHLPEGWHVRVKEHPSAKESFADLFQGLSVPVYLDNGTDTFAQVNAAQVVLTTNSSVGLEAMFFDKSVVACGACFWAIDGVALDARDHQILAQVFRSPQAVNYDSGLRSAFLEFLQSEYYVSTHPEDAEGDKIRTRLTKGW